MFAVYLLVSVVVYLMIKTIVTTMVVTNLNTDYKEDLIAIFSTHGLLIATIKPEPEGFTAKTIFGNTIYRLKEHECIAIVDEEIKRRFVFSLLTLFRKTRYCFMLIFDKPYIWF